MGDLKQPTLGRRYSPRYLRSGSFTFSGYKPKKVSPLSKYGTNKYNLGFEVHKNIKRQGDTYYFDRDYYAINWKPGSTNKVFIEKSSYMNDGKKNKKVLSPEIPINNKNEVNHLVNNFKEAHRLCKILPENKLDSCIKTQLRK